MAKRITLTDKQYTGLRDLLDLFILVGPKGEGHDLASRTFVNDDTGREMSGEEVLEIVTAVQFNTEEV